MKRFTSILLALILTAGMLASCTRDKTNETDAPETGAPETNAVETSSPETAAPETDAPAGETGSGNTGDTVTAGGAKAALESVYGTFLDKLAPAFGAGSGEEIAGYFASPETELVTEVDPDSGEEFSYEMPVSGPGAIDLADTDTLAMTLLPADNADKLNSAAIFFNMMNMNNGTFSAFELKDGADAETIADVLKGAITGNQWMCGFPERYLIVNVDGVIISAFGLGDATNALKDAIAETFAGAVVIYDEAL